MNRNCPAASAARFLCGRKVINNSQIPLGQDPGANGGGKVIGYMQARTPKPAWGLNDKVGANGANHS